MNDKLAKAFQNGKAIIPFITCGDPSLQATADIIKAACLNGADIIGLRVPFSDPVAESACMQAASHRALAAGITADIIFDFAVQLNSQISAPVILISYANTVFSYGTERFSQNCAQAGIDGVILLDVPLEERQEFAEAFHKYSISLIPTAALIEQKRIERICQTAEGFIYFNQPSEGASSIQAFKAAMSQLQANIHMPVAVQLNLSVPEQAAAAKYADGIILETAAGQLIGKYGFKAAPYIGRLIAEIKKQIS